MCPDKLTIDVKVPSGKLVTLGQKTGLLTLNVDADFAGKSPAHQEYKPFEVLARRVKAIDGKPVPGYSYTKLLADFLDGDLKVIFYVTAAMDMPTPEQLAAAMRGSGLAAKEALDESVALYRLTGGAISFEQGMEFDERKRKLLVANLLAEMKPEKESPKE